tara:strand:+ start:67351 stop:68439 length:1089 start_codon:yes stop_codon:yes gene_type:complete
MDVKPKRIAVICNYELLKNRVGGMDYFFWAFNARCKEQNIQVDWFFPNTATHEDYKTFDIIFSKKETLEQCFISYIKSQKVQYLSIVTHFVELCTSFFSEIKKNQKAKVIAVDHNPRPLGGYPLKKRIKKRLKGFLYSKHIDLFVGVSKYTSRAILHDFGSFLKQKTKTVYNGVLIEDIMPKMTKRSKENPKFLVVSHLRYSKGIQDLIQAVNLLPENLKKDLKIDVYGDGSYKNELIKLIEIYNLKSVFNFKGSQSNLRELYKNYDYLIQPTHMECFSLSVLESLAANIPVITTPVGGNMEVVTNNVNGFVFEPENSEVLSDLLTEIIKGEKNILGNTRSQIESKFSIDRMVEEHMKQLGL